jgi:hypothetical protein
MSHPNDDERAEAKRLLSDGFERVEMAELKEIWAAQQARGILYNGCTNAALCDRYGAENVRHVLGLGWFRHTGALVNPSEQFGALS